MFIETSLTDYKKGMGIEMKKLFIWGAGDIGKRILNHLSDDWEITFVDSDKQRAGSYCQGKRVISAEEYFEKYSEEFILIAHLHEMESIEVLKKERASNYFIHCDLPGEFKEPYSRDTIKEYIIRYLGSRRDYVLYGLNIYSIIIDDWLNKNYGIHPYILVQNDISDEMTEKITQKYTSLKLINNLEQINGIKEVCVCSDNYGVLKESRDFMEYQIVDVYDCSDKIESYHNPAIENFHNLYEGKRCFIVATGPSLRMDDLDLLKEKKEICFSVNRIFNAFDKTDWRPDYYVVEDYRELDNHKEKINTWPEIKGKFVGDTSEAFWEIEHGRDVYRYHQHYEHYLNRLPKFSDDFSQRSYIGATVTYACIQLAAYMGFKEIYLLGVDCSYIRNSCNNYFFQENEQDTFNHREDNMILAYRAAEQYTQAHGIKIYNATRGGMLEEFERADFDSLFCS